MAQFLRPDFPPIALDDKGLASLGYVSACEGRSKSTLVWSLKALEAAPLSEVGTFQKFPLGTLLTKIETHRARLSDNTISALGQIRALHEPTQALRNRLVHGVWGTGDGDAAMMLDMRSHGAFEADDLEHGVVLSAEFARACHNFLFALANDIRDGRVTPAPQEGRGMAVRVSDTVVYF